MAFDNIVNTMPDSRDLFLIVIIKQRDVPCSYAHPSQALSVKGTPDLIISGDPSKCTGMKAAVRYVDWLLNSLIPIEGVDKAPEGATPRNAGNPEVLEDTGFRPAPE